MVVFPYKTPFSFNCAQTTQKIVTFIQTNSKATTFDRGREQTNTAVTPNNKIARKWKRKIKNRRERKGTTVIDSVATSSFWREEDDHIKTGIPSNK